MTPFIKDLSYSSIQITVDLYGHLISGGNKQAVDRLDGRAEQNPISSESATSRNLMPHGQCPDPTKFFNLQTFLNWKMG